MTYAATGIILRRRDFGEWDRLYTAYTREHGKLTLLGKGTRRPQAKLSSHLEPYAEVDLVIANGKAIDRITFARTIATSNTVAALWEHVRLAAFVCECVDALTKEHHRDPAVYDLLRDALRALTSANSSLITHHSSLITPFTIRLLSLLGYAPQLDRCIECRGALPSGPAAGVPIRGGLACRSCIPSIHGGIPLTQDDREYLTAATAAFSPFLPSAALRTFTQEFLNAHLWQPLQTDVVSRGLTSANIQRTMAES